ncbi:hypothetical protein Fot_50463 [Forsythia ovata]|uniref:Uncharacterized protein n=1 Tax=Forsythia ovata TaxID=205694 RepID=A0ABD1PY81_9LAMI
MDELSNVVTHKIPLQRRKYKDISNPVLKWSENTKMASKSPPTERQFEKLNSAVPYMVHHCRDEDGLQKHKRLREEDINEKTSEEFVRNQQGESKNENLNTIKTENTMDVLSTNPLQSPIGNTSCTKGTCNHSSIPILQ